MSRMANLEVGVERRQADLADQAGALDEVMALPAEMREFCEELETLQDVEAQARYAMRAVKARIKFLGRELMAAAVEAGAPIEADEKGQLFVMTKAPQTRGDGQPAADLMFVLRAKLMAKADLTGGAIQSDAQGRESLRMARKEAKKANKAGSGDGGSISRKHAAAAARMVLEATGKGLDVVDGKLIADEGQDPVGDALARRVAGKLQSKLQPAVLVAMSGPKAYPEVIEPGYSVR